MNCLMTGMLPIMTTMMANIAGSEDPRGAVYLATCGEEYRAVLGKHDMVSSMSRPANQDDNASCESFMKTWKRQEIYANQYVDLDHLRSNVEKFIEIYHNRQRLHSSLGYRSPEEFEQQAQDRDYTTISRCDDGIFEKPRECFDTDTGQEDSSAIPFHWLGNERHEWHVGH